MAVAMLSTGDELVNGDVQNTTTHEMAHELFSHNIALGSQMVVSDDHKTMLEAMRFLLTTHDVLVVTGGLGPTSDDRTRFAMAAYFDEPLIFHDACWAHITTRHQQLAIETSDNNRQQALFPESAQLFPNPHGTAYGCMYTKNGKTIYLLPGPPNECMPMFYDHALPLLKSLQEESTELYRWLLFGVPEAAIANQVEQALSDTPCDISYRWFYPYIEVKIKVTDKGQPKSFFDKKLEGLFKPLTISPPDQTALMRLKETIEHMNQRVLIEDEVTHGALESELSKPGNTHVQFHKTGSRVEANIQIKGLSRYWEGDKAYAEDHVQMIFKNKNKQEEKTVPISLQKSQVLPYTIELIAFYLNNWLHHG